LAFGNKQFNGGAFMSVELDTIKQQAAALSLREKAQLVEFLNEQLKQDAQAQSANGSIVTEDKEEIRQRPNG
jgi:hypothetical protein